MLGKKAATLHKRMFQPVHKKGLLISVGPVSFQKLGITNNFRMRLKKSCLLDVNIFLLTCLKNLIAIAIESNYYLKNGTCSFNFCKQLDMQSELTVCLCLFFEMVNDIFRFDILE